MERARKSAAKTGRAKLQELSRLVALGDQRAAAQALTWIECRDARGAEILKLLHRRTGGAHIIGVTGSAGSGKSTLIACLTTALRRQKKKVGILATDPTSPFSEGSLLGDRIRMRNHFLDREVFIRSLATRGSPGGLSACVGAAAQLLAAMGKEFIFIETIGIGQDQIEVSQVAHTVIVVVTPQAGDEIQALKAGIFEIADLLVINKADLAGAEELFLSLNELVADGAVTILKTSAHSGEGVETLVERIKKHRAELLSKGNHRRRVVKKMSY